MLKWEKLGEEKFNRAVEMLIMRTIEEDDPGLKVTAIDGRGGDGGIDLDVRVKKTGQLVAIYQLKHFPEGFSNEWAKARKPQIRKSFEAAMKHNPGKWILVIPRNFTSKERSFVTSLKGDARGLHIKHIGATELDNMLARFPEIDDYINRDESRAALEMVSRGSAFLAKPTDLATELHQIGQRVKARSSYWGVNFAKRGSDVYEEVFALRDDAAEREPLKVTLTTDFTDQTQLGDEFQKALDYGLLYPIHLPSSVITGFEKHGPEWFAGVIDVLGIKLLPARQDLEVLVKIVLRSSSGRILWQPTAIAACTTSGQKGDCIQLKVMNGVKLNFLVERSERNRGTLNFEVQLEELSGADAKNVLSFLTALSSAEEFTLMVGEMEPISVRFSGEKAEPPVSLVELADDLAAIEKELGVSFSFPKENPKNYERIWIRIIRRVLAGEVSYIPAKDLNFTMVSPDLKEIEAWLKDGIFALGMHVDDWEWEILSQTLIVDDVTLCVLDGHIVDGQLHLEAFKSNPDSPRQITYSPKDKGGGVVIFSRTRREPDLPLEAIPWEITGIIEHSHFLKSDAETSLTI